MFDLADMAEADRALDALSSGRRTSEKPAPAPERPEGDISRCPHLAAARDRAA
jgi:hypothetical protein